jgi:hypothetical protein
VAPGISTPVYLIPFTRVHSTSVVSLIPSIGGNTVGVCVVVGDATDVFPVVTVADVVFDTVSGGDVVAMVELIKGLLIGQQIDCRFLFLNPLPAILKYSFLFLFQKQPKPFLTLEIVVALISLIRSALAALLQSSRVVRPMCVFVGHIVNGINSGRAPLLHTFSNKVGVAMVGVIIVDVVGAGDAMAIVESPEGLLIRQQID